MDLSHPGSMQSASHDLNDPSKWIVVWTELQVPFGLESDKQQWVGYFQPLVHATGHKQSIWARLRFSLEKVILDTCKSSPSEAMY